MNSTLFNFMTSIVGTGMNKAANGKKTDLVTTPALDALDVAGYNYASGRYKGEGKLHPNRLIVGSETFPQDIAKNWEMVKTLPYLAGDFMWTAWDYIGEVGIGAWGYTDDAKGFDKPYPWLLADAGAFDILGNPNGEVFLAQAAWGAVNAPRISVQPINHGRKKPAKAIWRGTNGLPSWSWSGCAGAKAVVEVYSDALEVGLELALEVGGGLEVLLIAQEGEKFYAYGLAVEVAVEVEKVDFYALLGEGTEGGTAAYVEHTDVCGSGCGGADDIGGMAGQELKGLAGGDVGRGEPKGVSYALAVGNGAGEAVGSAQQLVGQGDIAVGECLADGGG